ncbi:MAG: dienelactone hydrolase family protein [Limisphaerales bacterium]
MNSSFRSRHAGEVALTPPSMATVPSQASSPATPAATHEVPDRGETAPPSRGLVRSVWVFLVGVLAATGCAAPGTKTTTTTTTTPVATGQHPGHLSTSVATPVELDYLLFLPKDYQPKGPKRWPLIVFLHGAGERGTNVELVAVHGPPKLVRENPDFPFVVLSPQCPAGTSWRVEVLGALLDDALTRLAVDPNQVYLTGLSMGGYGSWAWAAAHPERFAAVAPICGGGDPLPVRLSSGATREALSRIPIWAFHGAQDRVVALTESQRMVEAYKTVGNDVRLTVYPDAGHDSWTETYKNPELFDWFRQHTLR